MQWKTIGLVALLAGSAFTGTSALAEDKKDDKAGLAGSWERKGGDLKIEFLSKEQLKIYPHGEKHPIVVLCDYTVDKDGVVKAKLQELQASEEIKQKAKGALPVGLKFQFKWNAKNDSATISDLEGEDTQPLKSHLEGEYEKK